MGCDSCSTKKNADGTPAGCRNNGACSSGGCNKLTVFDWLSNMELPAGQQPFDIVEVRFKNSRKQFFKNTFGLTLQVGDVVALESSPGYDIGVVSIAGELVRLQLNKKEIQVDSAEIKKVLRKASAKDIETWQEARTLEDETMFRSRAISSELGLKMKMSDVEYQGDKSKATFYYTADDRVDFRDLIKRLAEEFKVRIEMRQIGARQEASRLGGIGSCGRELCCTTWLQDFRTVTTGAARYQQLSLNPQKLAGQCGKLKCCLNYELDMYIEAVKEFPDTDTKLKTQRGTAVHFKTDIFNRMIWYVYEGYQDQDNSPVALKVDQVRDVMAKNQKGVIPFDLKEFAYVEEKSKAAPEPDYANVDAQDSLTRFDKKKGNNDRRDNRNRPNNNERRPNPNQTPTGERSNSTEANPNQNRNDRPRPERAPNPNQNRPQGANAENRNENKPRPERAPNPNQNRNDRPRQERAPNPNQRPIDSGQTPDASATPNEAQANRPQRNNPRRDNRNNNRNRRPNNDSSAPQKPTE